MFDSPSDLKAEPLVADTFSTVVAQRCIHRVRNWISIVRLAEP
ncbi:MAG: hypothetical protein ACOYEV_05010 [Candidatus Nanopelagicales bacterium]